MPAGCLISRRGVGPDLVMVHGWGMHSGVWGEFADHLAEKFTLHMVNLPGHGGAPPGRWGLEDVALAILETTPPAAWLGWSLGGQVAIRAAVESPQQVRKLALIGTNPRFVASADWQHAMPSRLFDTFQRGLSADPPATIERFLALQVVGSTGAVGTLKTMRELAAGAPPPDVAGLDAGLEILRHTDLLSVLPTISMSTSWINGGQDRLVPATCAAAAAGAMQQANWAEIPGAGHAPFISHPEATLAALHGLAALESAA